MSIFRVAQLEQGGKTSLVVRPRQRHQIATVEVQRSKTK